MTSTAASWSLNAMTYASASFSPKQVNTEPNFAVMSLSGSYTSSINVFNGQSADSGYVQVIGATSNTITVRLLMNTDLSF